MEEVKVVRENRVEALTCTRLHTARWRRIGARDASERPNRKSAADQGRRRLPRQEIRPDACRRPSQARHQERAEIEALPRCDAAGKGSVPMTGLEDYRKVHKLDT